jgi:hypothetical protein
MMRLQRKTSLLQLFECNSFVSVPARPKQTEAWRSNHPNQQLTWITTYSALYLSDLPSLTNNKKEFIDSR